VTAPSDLRHYPFEPFTGDVPDELIDMVESNPISQVLLPDGRPCWLVLNYEHCRTVITDPRFARLHIGRPDGGPRDLNMDGPAHTAVRRVGMRPFTARRIEVYRPLVQRLVDELIDDMIAGPCPADIVTALVAPLPVRVICEVLGIPVADRQRFMDWIATLNSMDAYGSDPAGRARSELTAYLAGQLTAKRESPGQDLLSAWAANPHDLTDAELVELAIGVLLGGLEINTISAGLRALFQHPEQLAKLRAAPEKMVAATEEIIRYTTVSTTFRVMLVTADAEVGGVTMRAGDYVMPFLPAGDRDPAVFPEPNVFDIDRPQTPPHLGLGHGPHFCLGGTLGKLEVEVSIGTLVRRLPGLAPAVPLEEIGFRHGWWNCGISSFPVVW
jgi:cytochrome P450